MIRLLTAAAAIAAVAALAPLQAGGGPLVPLPRATADRLDDFSGLQVHMVYAVPSDGTDREFDTDGSIQNAVDAFQRWLSVQTEGRTLRIDTYQGSADVTFRRLPTPDGQYPFGPIIDDLKQAGLMAPGKVYGVYYEGGAQQQVCGGAGWPQWPEPASLTVAVIFLRGLGGACFHGFPPPGGEPNYTVFAMFHDLMHTFGIVGTCAPHHNNASPAHVNDSNADLMYSGPFSWNPSVLDFGKDDYYMASIPGCVDLDTVGFLTRPTSSQVNVKTEGDGPGRVVSAPWPLIDCRTACTVSYPTGTVIALYAMPESDSSFEGWGGACSGLSRCLLTIDSSKAVTASFHAPARSIYVSTSGTGLGTVTSQPQGIRCPARCTRTFPNRTAVRLRPVPGAGSRFRGWSIECSGVAPCSVTLDADKAVDARFADVEAPRMRALPSSGRRGGLARLRYRVFENTRIARVTARVYGIPGRRASSTRKAFRRVSPAVTYAIPWRVPRSLTARAVRFCVRAADRAGRSSRSSCARLRLR